MHKEQQLIENYNVQICHLFQKLLNKIEKKNVDYTGEKKRIVSALHIIKTNQQIGWGHQYTQTVHYLLVPKTKLSRTLATI